MGGQEGSTRAEIIPWGCQGTLLLSPPPFERPPRQIASLDSPDVIGDRGC
jgi:hypothetical protein